MRARESGSGLRGRVVRELGCEREMMGAWKNQRFTRDGKRVAIYILTGLLGKRAGSVGWGVAVVVHSLFGDKGDE